MASQESIFMEVMKEFVLIFINCLIVFVIMPTNSKHKLRLQIME